GYMDFKGLVIVRGPVDVSGELIVFGSVWARGTTLTVGGSPWIQYSRQGLGYASAVGADAACQPPPVCGDGDLGGTEECDDGNTTDGDCCSATCSFEPNGAPCADDANACTADHCDGGGACRHDGVDGPCDDGTVCTTDDACAAGSCVGVPVSCAACER